MRSAILHGAAALATFALVLTRAPDAGAATVLTTATALPSTNQAAACIVTNIDTRPITVTVQLFDPLTDPPGSPVTPAFDHCPTPPATLPPGAACVARLHANIHAYCVVTTSSAKVRVALDVFNSATESVEEHIPATK
jgi:hypothetical protein